jgi:hypothetical protein
MLSEFLQMPLGSPKIRWEGKMTTYCMVLGCEVGSTGPESGK